MLISKNVILYTYLEFCYAKFKFIAIEIIILDQWGLTAESDKYNFEYKTY